MHVGCALQDWLTLPQLLTLSVCGLLLDVCVHSKPDAAGVFAGLLPTVPDGALYAAVGMLGATGTQITQVLEGARKWCVDYRGRGKCVVGCLYIQASSVTLSPCVMCVSL